MTDLVVGVDKTTRATYSIPFSENGFIINMSLGNAYSLAVPADARVALLQFTPGSSVLVSPTMEPSQPTAAFAVTDADLNPAVRTIEDANTLHFLAITASIVKVSFYEI